METHSTPVDSELTNRDAGVSAWQAAGLSVLLWALLIVPLLWVEHAPSADWPNHQVRHWIAANPAVLADQWVLEWRLVPNLGADLLAVPLSWFLSPTEVGRVIMAISMAGWVAAPVVLHRVIWGRYSTWPLLAGFLVYNAAMSYGFENFYLTAPIAVLAYATWLALEGRPAVRVAVVTLLGGVVYVGHLYAFTVFALLVASDALATAWRDRRLGVLFGAGAALILPTLHFLWWFGQGTGQPAGFTWGTPAMKVWACISPVLTFPAPDGTAVILLVLVVVAMVVFSDSPRLPRRVAVALGVLLLAGLLTPHELGGINFSDVRIPPVLAMVLFGSLHGSPPRRTWWVVLGAYLLCGYRVGRELPHWRAHDEEVAELRSAMSTLPEHAVVLPVANSDNPGPLRWHAHVMGVVDRGLLFGGLFSGPHILQPRESIRHLARAEWTTVQPRYLLRPEEADREAVHSWRSDYDYVLVYTTEPLPDLRAMPALSLWRAGSFFRIYEIDLASDAR